MNAKQRLDLKLNIWFSLTRQQHRKADSLGICHVLLEQCDIADFKRVTKNKKLINDLITLKRESIRLVA